MKVELVVGIDPGLRHCGVVVLRRDGQRWKLVASKLVVTSPKEHLETRLAKIFSYIEEAIVTGAQLVASEDQARVQEGKRAAGRTSFDALYCRDVQNMARGAAWAAKAAFAAIDPDIAKSAVTGSRTASKKQVQRAVQAILQLDQELSEHESDAVAAAIAAARAQATGLSGSGRGISGTHRIDSEPPGQRFRQ